MRFFAIALFVMLVSAHPAFCQGVVLMVNMNYSSQELKAADEMAAARGQRVEMVPPREMIKLVEPMFMKRDILRAELVKEFPNTNPLKLKSALAGIMRKGATWNDDPAVAAFIGSERMNELREMAQKVSRAEQQHGEMYDQLRRKASELKTKGDRVDAMILSSHADGSNLTGETAIRLSANELFKLKQEQASLFDSVRHVLLLGCYNMTEPNHKAWRNDLFPNASMLAGFGIRAPSRFDQKSANFIRQTMTIADSLDRQMVAAGRPLDPVFLADTFKKLSTFTTEAHPGVVDYCYTILEGQPGTWSRDCDIQWKDLYAKKAKLRDSWSLIAPREDPPSASGGELRTFYNTLQAACPAKEAKSERDDWKASERMRVTLRENVIRLIFWWNVQSNFSTYFESDIGVMNARLRAAGILDTMPKLDGTAGRVDFVGAYNSIHHGLKNNPSLQRDFIRLYGPLFFLKGEDTVAAGEKISVTETLARNAIPFNWIEGNTVLRKK